MTDPATDRRVGDGSGLSVAQALGEIERRLRWKGPDVQDSMVGLAMGSLFPGVLAAAYDAECRYLWVSPAFSSMTGLSAEDLLGRSITELFEPRWANERVSIVRRVLESRMPLATVEIFRGCRMEAAVLPLVCDGPQCSVGFIGRFGLSLPTPDRNERTAVTSSSASGAGARWSRALREGDRELKGWPTETLHVPDWGGLALLTRREKEVLRLIAMGLENGEIAERIHRTKRAVEFHVNKLYEYLECRTRTELFRLGLYAGLGDIDEVHWARMVGEVGEE